LSNLRKPAPSSQRTSTAVGGIGPKWGDGIAFLQSLVGKFQKYVDEKLWDEKDAVCGVLGRTGSIHDGFEEIAKVSMSKGKLRALQKLGGV
jgi:hypothetical protein